jgi:tetratricopeptide (TPR) repeat protein
MSRISLAAGVAAAALFSQSAIAQPAPSPMPGMNHGAMAAMPAVYGGQADKPGAPVFKGLGDHHHKISTKVAETQRFFDQGVNLLFGFNHAEAIRSFTEAARLDPDCAMCWWGVAFALGPNINLPMTPDANAPALQALAKAQALAPKASAEEREWIEALAARYSADSKADRHALDEAFAAAMGKLWRAHPNDLDAGSFYAEAMMDSQPWDYWAPDGVTPKGHAVEIVSTLEGIIKREPNHPGALHLYIHAVEASTTPERAEAAADRLLKLMPEAGHIVHMPSHIYYRVGRYDDAVKANELAAKVDEDYIAACKAQGFYPAAYYGHNIHFLWTSSEMEGRYAAALDASRRLIKAVDAVHMAEQLAPMEPFVFTPLATMVRFGRWDDILAEPAAPPSLTLANALSFYARGFAHTNKHDMAAARIDRERLAAALNSNFSKYEPFGVPAKQMIALGLELLDGEMARASGDLPGAIAHFRAANDMQHNLPYTEPPYWHQPVAHLLGAALMQAGKPAEAEAVYRESLKTYRVDGWSLYGLAQALKAQGKAAEAASVEAQYKQAWRLADVELASSRF